MRVNLDPTTEEALRKVFGEHLDKALGLIGILIDGLPHTELVTSRTARSRRHNPGRYKINGNRLRLWLPYRTEPGGVNRRTRAGRKIKFTRPRGRRESLFIELRKHQSFNQTERLFIESAFFIIRRSFRTLVTFNDPALIGISETSDRIVGTFLTRLTDFTVDFTGIIRFYRDLAQRSYENRAFTYAVVVSKFKRKRRGRAIFPQDILRNKRFHAITDGFRTALHLAHDGSIVRLGSLDPTPDRGERKKFRPLWLEPLADQSSGKAIGLTLSRQGDILVTYNRDLLISYRGESWMLWNHSENIRILTEQCHSEGRPPVALGKLLSKLYRSSLDISFRRTGGMFFILEAVRSLGKFVPSGEEMLGKKRKAADKAIDRWLKGTRIAALRREALTDLASLDGAVVCSRGGRILAYGSVLRTPNEDGLSEIEGSRSRAAHSASQDGLVIKISSDGPITIKKKGATILKV